MNGLVVLLSKWALEIALTLFLGATLVVSAAWVLTRALRRASAATRHAVWAVAFVLLATLPVARPLAWDWSVEAPIPAVPVPHPAMAEIAISGTSGADEGSPDRATSAVERAALPEAHQFGSPTGPFMTQWTAAMAVLIWFLGAAVLLCRLAVHASRAAGVIRRGIPVRGRRIRAALRTIGRVTVPVVQSEETDNPWLGGFRHPTVVLPMQASMWPHDLLESVLLHETAHMDRRDHATHLLSRFVMALYWPNPLVKMGARRLLHEQERSCDDCVLRHRSPVEYARHLVDVARISRAADLNPVTTPMLASPPLCHRIRDVLAVGADRRPASAVLLIPAVLLLSLVALPAMAITLERAVAPDPNLFGALEQQNADVRRRAAWALGEFENARSVGPLLGRTEDPDPRVRGTVAWALGEIKDRRAVGRLIAMLQEDDDALVREMAALALGEIGARSAITALRAAAAADADASAAAEWAVAEIVNNAVPATSANTIPGLGDWIDHPDQLLRLMRSNHALTSTQPLVRARAVLVTRAARGAGDLAAVTPLLDALRDSSMHVRAMAVWSLDEVNVSARAR